MNTSLYIGKTARSRRFTLPLDAATETISILAKRGAGKTYTASVIAEEMLEQGLHVVVLDPLDVWWGLRASADGRSEGFPITVFGGSKADVPLEGSEGTAIADAIVDHRISAILSLRHMSKKRQLAFVTAFASRLYERKGDPKHRDPMHLFIDEADTFAPQQVRPWVAPCMGAVDDLVRRGRASGIGVTLITQRSAAINKDVLTQTELLVCLRTTGPNDRKAVQTWVDAHDADDPVDEFMASLTRLEVGEAWFWSPGWLQIFKRVRVRRRRTFDSSSTPRVGKRIKAPKRMAPVDLEALRTRLADSIRAADEKDPAALRRQLAERDRTIARLEREVAAKSDPDPRAIERAVDEALRRAEEDWGRWRESVCETLKTGLGPRLEGCRSALDAVLTECRNGSGMTPDRAKKGPHIPLVIPPNYSKPAPTPVLSKVGAKRPGGGKQRILISLAQFPAGLSARKISLLTGLSHKSGTFGTYLAQLRSEGCLDGTRERLKITPAGLGVVGQYEPLPTGVALRTYWHEKIGSGGIQRLFAAICGHWPAAVPKQEAAEAAGLSARSGTFGTYLSRLRGLDLIEGSAELKAHDDLFGP